MASTRTYLDHNATSPLRPEAREAMMAVLDHPVNASSIHAEGRAARASVETARDELAQAVGCSSQMVILTSGGTEANNLAVKGAPVERIIVAATEHPAVMEAANATGKPVSILPVDGDGIVDLVALEALLSDGDGGALVCVMLANNETGAIQPVAEVSKIAHGYDALVHCDAVQALGKQPVRFVMLGADMLTVTAHKLGGPQGAGALIVRDGLALEAQQHGGGQELRRRPGTENVAAIAGFGAVAKLANKQTDYKALRDRFESALQEIAPDAVIFAGGAERLDNTSCFAVPGLSAEIALMALDLDGIAVSSGSACSSGKVSVSPVLAAMGIDEDLATGAIRLSVGWSTTQDDIDTMISVLRRIVEKHKDRAAA